MKALNVPYELLGKICGDSEKVDEFVKKHVVRFTIPKSNREQVIYETDLDELFHDDENGDRHLYFITSKPLFKREEKDDGEDPNYCGAV